MSKPIVFATRLLPEAVMVKLQEVFDLRFGAKNLPLSKPEIITGVQEAEGMISMLSDVIDHEVLEAAPKLKIVSNYAVGYNNIDLETAKVQNITVTNTPGVLTETTADLALALLMAVARRIPEANEWVKSGQWSGWAPTEMMGTDIYGQHLGLIGMGRIAQAVARRARGFGMRISYFSRRQLPATLEADLDVRYLPLFEVIEKADYLSLHVPLNDSTHHLIDRKALHRMKKTAFLINTARGAVVDEAALCEALTSAQIAGAGLDVFEAEPIISSALLRLKNVVTLPHIGSASLRTREKMGMIVFQNLSAVFSGKKPPNSLMVD
ncbi:MAG: D-glycerate dehydrogenase [Nitrospirota bacterium]|nr:D-glycerate dehydrogenase [Nitrospirota bacterium]